MKNRSRKNTSSPESTLPASYLCAALAAQLSASCVKDMARCSDAIVRPPAVWFLACLQGRKGRNRPARCAKGPFTAEKWRWPALFAPARRLQLGRARQSVPHRSLFLRFSAAAYSAKLTTNKTNSRLPEPRHASSGISTLSVLLWVSGKLVRTVGPQPPSSAAVACLRPDMRPHADSQ